MLGAIIGDITGSYYSDNPTLRTDCGLINPEAHFTQNAVLFSALCDLLCYNDRPAHGKIEGKLFAREAAGHYKKFAGEFITLLDGPIKTWAAHGSMIKSSVGASAAMIAALPCAYVYKSYETAAAQAALACEYIYGTDSSKNAAKALVTAVFLLQRNASIDQTAAICRQVSGIDFSEKYRDFSKMKQEVQSDTSPETVMQTAFAAFCSSSGFSQALKLSFACGRVSHITAAAAGAMAQAAGRNIPDKFIEFAVSKEDVRHKRVAERFIGNYCKNK